jgi:hypothetical protein
MVGVGGHGDHAERALAAVDAGGAPGVAGDRESEQRAAGPGQASDGVADGRWRAVVRVVGAGGRLRESTSDHVSGAAVRSGGAWGAEDRGRARSAADVRSRGAGPDRGDGAAISGSEGRWDGDVVAEHVGAIGAAGRAPVRGSYHHSSGVARGRQLVSADPDVVSDGHGAAQAQGRRGPGGRSEDGRKKGAIEHAYRLAEAAGIPVWCQDEAGPYQAIPQPGTGWAPAGQPTRQPHEYIRGGTAKLLTLFHPATGAVRAKGVANAPNAVPHPWLRAELTAVLATLPSVTASEDERPPLARWATWLGHDPTEPLPPLRMLLIWDNLARHLSWSIVRWLFQHGVMPLYTPISGSWLTTWPSRSNASSSGAPSTATTPNPETTSSPGSMTPSPAGMPTQPRSSGRASATNADSVLANVAWAAHHPLRPTLNHMQRDPLVVPAATRRRSQSSMVPPIGFEPTTVGLEGRCSVH